MARRSRKLPGSFSGAAAHLQSLEPYVSGLVERPPSLFTIDWQQIEQAYGTPLSADVREALVRTTEMFILFEEPERTGESVTHVHKIIEASKKQASEFQRALPSSQSAAWLFISPGPSNRPFAIIHGLLTWFDAACTDALQKLSKYPSFKKEGDAWGLWIRRLNQIMETEGLSTGVRKDAGNKSKSDKQSPFTSLVATLQSCLPVECRRHTHSTGALAVAISRALGSNKTAAPS
jgi:hypothetical protein